MKDSIRSLFFRSMIQTAKKHWDIAQDLKMSLSLIMDTWESIKDTEDSKIFYYDNIDPIEEEINESCIITILLCSFGLEGYIFDYAARNFSDKFALDLDRLDAVSKWIVIPQLVTGKKFPRDRRAFQLLRELVRNRNYLVHPKSTNFLVFNEKTLDYEVSGKFEKMSDFLDSLYEKARDAIDTIEKLALEIEELDPNEKASRHLSVMVGRNKEHFKKYGI